jgi:hypothetical protein
VELIVKNWLEMINNCYGFTKYSENEIACQQKIIVPLFFVRALGSALKWERLDGSGFVLLLKSTQFEPLFAGIIIINAYGFSS